MKKTLVVGSLNMDLITRVIATPQVGETVFGQDFEYVPGGKGANQAVAMGKLGANVTMVGVVGDDDYGKQLLASLKENNVHIDHITLSKNAQTGTAIIILNENGNNSIIVIPGANFQLTEDLITENLLSGYDYLVAQLEIPIATLEKVFKIAKAKNIFTVLNPAPAQSLSAELISNIDLLIPNDTEFELLTGNTTKSEQSIQSGVSKLKKMGVKNILLTLGHKGSRYFGADGQDFSFGIYNIKVVDTTAAGDSFIGGLVTALSMEKNIHDAIDFATKVATITVSRHGAQASLPTLEMVENFDATSGKKEV